MRALRRRFLSDRRGAVAVMTTLCMMALLASAAVGIDVGEVFMKSRQLQGVADLAAMASAQALDPTSQTTPAAAATATAGLNPWPGGIAAQAAPGVYTADASLPANQRFTATKVSPNAVQVTLRASAPLYFGGLLIGRSSVDVVRTAIATRAEYAAFSIGSGLAGLNGGVANALLSAMTGSQVQLSAANYQALASANVDLLQYMPALQSRAGLQAMSFSHALAVAVTPSTALNALADTLMASGQTSAAAAASSLAAAAAPLAATPLNALFSLGPYGAQDHALDVGGASVSVGALALADAVIGAATGGRQVSVSLDGVLPDLAKLSLVFAIGQRPSQSPWVSVTDAGQVVVRTAQLRLYVQAQLAPGALAAATGGALISLPIYAEAASGQAELLDLQCPSDPSAQTFDLSVSPSLGTLAVAQVNQASLNTFSTPMALQPATLMSAPLLGLTAFSQVNIGGGQASWRTVSFSQADVAAQTMKSVFTTDVAQASISSLLSTTNVSIQAGPLVLGGAAAVSPVLQSILTQAAPSLDTVLTQVEAISGVRVGEADVWANGLRCHSAALVA